MLIGWQIAYTFQTSRYQGRPVEARVCVRVSNFGSLYKCHQSELIEYFSQYEILDNDHLYQSQEFHCDHILALRRYS